MRNNLRIHKIDDSIWNTPDFSQQLSWVLNIEWESIDPKTRKLIKKQINQNKKIFSELIKKNRNLEAIKICFNTIKLINQTNHEPWELNIRYKNLSKSLILYLESLKEKKDIFAYNYTLSLLSNQSLTLYDFTYQLNTTDIKKISNIFIEIANRLFLKYKNNKKYNLAYKLCKKTIELFLELDLSNTNIKQRLLYKNSILSKVSTKLLDKNDKKILYWIK